MKAVVAAFNQEKALVGAFSVITNFRMELFEALVPTAGHVLAPCRSGTHCGATAGCLAAAETSRDRGGGQGRP